MKEFIQRNKPVFFIGLITIIVFVLIIVASLKQKATQIPELKKIQSQEAATTKSDDFFVQDTTQTTTNNQPEDLTANSPETTGSKAWVDAKYGTLMIDFTKDGFVQRNSRAMKNQLVRWTNKTDKEIAIEQLLKYYPDWTQPKVIPAGGYIEYRLTVENYWTFRERDTKSFGSVYVVPVPSQTDVNANDYP